MDPASILCEFFRAASLDVPKGLLSLFEEEEVGAAGRRRVYGRLYTRIRASLPPGKYRVVWPGPIREAVRVAVKKADGEVVGLYDQQHENNPAVHHVTADELARVDWLGSIKRKRVASPGPAFKKIK